MQSLYSLFTLGAAFIVSRLDETALDVRIGRNFRPLFHSRIVGRFVEGMSK